MNSLKPAINTELTDSRLHSYSDPAIEQLLPTTMAQKEIWISVQQGDDASCACNEAMEITFDTRIDSQALVNALNELNCRHIALRSTYSHSGDQLIVKQHADINCPVLEANSQSPTMDSIRHAEVSIAFDLEKESLWRCQLVLHEDSSSLFATFHHAVVDHYSIALLIKELGLLYKKHTSRGTIKLPSVQNFGDYVSHHYSQETENKEAESYWLNQFSAPVPVLELPTDFSRPPLRTYNADRVDYILADDLVDTLKESATKSGTTLFTWLLAAYSVFLYRISGQPQHSIGVPAIGQSVAGMEHLVGHCVNVLPIRLDIPAAASFEDFLRNCRSVVQSAHDHQEFNFCQLLSKLELSRDRSRVPMLATAFNIEQKPHEIDFGETKASYRTTPRCFEKFEWFYNLVVTNNTITIECSYNTDLFTEQTIKHRLSEFSALITSLVADPTTIIEDAQVISDEDQQLLYEINSTQFSLPDEQCLFQRFEKSVSLYGEKSAVVFKETNYSYELLNQRANKLANFLLTLGTESGDIIALYLNRTTEMLVALLAVQKTGACYLPLDPDYPADRIKYILTHAKVTAIITESSLQADLPFSDVETLSLDGLETTLATMSDLNPGLSIAGSRPAYVIYTSGSTGNPKGVLVSHKNVLNFLASMQHNPGITVDDRLLAVTTLSFDIAVLELYLPLISGATVVISDRETALDGNALSELIESENITMMQATPATWRNLLAAKWSGNKNLKALIGGEALPGDLIAPLLQLTQSLWNMYGPTETTVWSTCIQVKRVDDPIRIGRPINNTTIYVLDDNQRQVAIGCDGELYIGGDGVSIGYIHQPELSAERFISDPFSSDPDARLYRTGDLCRLHSNGLLEYISRLDNQVKLRGYRIELGEIETALTKHAVISQCIATICEVTNDDSRLVAYYTTHGNDPGHQELRTLAKQSLPDYMVPHHSVYLDSFPQTPNGKIDRKALPKPNFSATKINEKYLPRSKTEKNVAAEWSTLIGSSGVAYTDNFFEIGGHSLLAMKFISEMQEQYKVRIPLRSLLGDSLAQIAVQLDPSDQPLNVPYANPNTNITSAKITTNHATFVPATAGDIFTQLHTPVKPSAMSHAVLICNPIGHEYMRSHRALQQLAQQLCESGFHVLRFDYFGTGDSDGCDQDVDLAIWQKNIQTAQNFLMQTSHCRSLSIVGLRFGATLAASLPSLCCDKLILWDPIISSENYIKQLREMHRSMLRDLDRFRWMRHDAVSTVHEELLGYRYSTVLQKDICEFTLGNLANTRIKELISLQTVNNSNNLKALNAWASNMTNHRHFEFPDTCHWCDTAQSESALLPHDIQRKIVNLLTGKE